ncbi:unnamed protein product [Thlaspi arvense]|uniref:Uncharacterized protein n=1 Tax=Thlaspi arvense TaxID=13288 RepID=A0AAU9S6S1_THLAR|nr:unnamed protein product [Thlaspi arvense]
MQFLSCLRRIRFDFRCFGSFPTTDLASDVEEDDQEEKENEDYGKNEKAGSTVFSKWFMVLQEEQSKYKKEIGKERESSVLPPPNALLLMRCRSAPAKSWAKVQEAEEEEKAEIEDEHKKGEDKKDNLKVKEGKRRKSLASLMREENDFDKLACGIAKETCVVGGLKDPFSRSRSWKR